jgi:hypothetical protein
MIVRSVDISGIGDHHCLYYLSLTKCHFGVNIHFQLELPASCKVGMCCFSTKHTVLRRKSKDWLPLNQDNVSEWGDMSTSRLLFQCASPINIQLSVLV